MKSIILVLLFSIAAFSCSNESETNKENLNVLVSHIPVTEKALKLLWGINNQVDSSNALELTIYYINRSMYKSALQTLKSKYTLDTINTGGFCGFKIAGNFEVGNYERYILFRLNEYLGNLSENELEVQLVKSVVDPKNELYALQTIEYKYLQNRKQGNVDVAKKMIYELKDVEAKFPTSQRVKLLLANEYLFTNNIDDALKLFDDLIENNYYALVSLRAITQYLAYTKSPLYKKYSSLFQEKFPNECNLSRIRMFWETIGNDSLSILCESCVKSDFQKDSIFSRLYLAKSYLNKKQFEKVDSVINDFIRNYDVFVFDSTLLFERGLYSDFKMRSLFLQQRYKEICEFVKTDLGYNLVIKIDTEEEFKMYIQHLYTEYVSSSMTDFDTFFKRNFDCYGE